MSNLDRASLPEQAVYRGLLQNGKKPDIDFIYQSPMFGGNIKGGVILDFLILNPPNLAINVTSRYYHYGTTVMRMADELQRSAIESLGITVIFIAEEDALRNAKYYVSEALRGRDHSIMAGG